LVYEFSYFFCDKKRVDNSFEKPKMISKKEEVEKNELNKNQIINKKNAIYKEWIALNETLKEYINTISKVKINRDDIENNHVDKIL